MYKISRKLDEILTILWTERNMNLNPDKDTNIQNKIENRNAS